MDSPFLLVERNSLAEGKSFIRYLKTVSKMELAISMKVGYAKKWKFRGMAGLTSRWKPKNR